MPTHKAGLHELSTSQLSELTGCAHATVRKRLATARVEPIREDGRTKWFDPRAALPAIYTTGGGENGEVLNLDQQRARLAKEQADAQEIKNAVSRKELVPGEEVEEAWVRIGSLVRTKLLGISSRVAPLIHGKSIKVIEARVREAITDALRELADTKVA